MNDVSERGPLWPEQNRDGGRLQNFIKHFRRLGQGVWVCVEPATLELPQGRIQVTPGSQFTTGTRFMNVELARLLDDQYERTSGK